jgi:2,3-bisphosphoglycerate-independent phosphoglycerate mutase
MANPLILIVLDGWGYREQADHNAINAATKPNWDYFWKNYPHMLLSASGTDVGLPVGQMGNSEVGHMNLGAGRIIFQDLGKIDHEIAIGEFEQNPILVKMCQDLAQSKKALHIMGLFSPGGVHSHENHFYAMLALAKKQRVEKVYLHLFLDGRDTPPQSARGSIEYLQQLCVKLGNARIASIIGRYYAMDRDKRWERTELAFNALVNGEPNYVFDNAIDGLEAAYARGEKDEFVKPTAIRNVDQSVVTINDGDAIMCMNFRADRARQLTRAFIDPKFDGFSRVRVPALSHFASLTEYAKDLSTEIAFPNELPKNSFPECIERAGLKQLRIAETEKYAHVTFFFSCGREQPFVGEDRRLIPSPKIATYDLQPEMSAVPLTDELVAAIKSQQYDVIIVNYANSDMVGHTGDYDAAVKAIEAIDQCLGRVYHAAQEVGGEILITADHGNAEMMYDANTKQAHTAHTTELVPLLYLGNKGKFKTDDVGVLADVAPTMLTLLGLAIPEDMTGRVLIG